jgi:hypothetical protein
LRDKPDVDEADDQVEESSDHDIEELEADDDDKSDAEAKLGKNK